MCSSDLIAPLFGVWFAVGDVPSALGDADAPDADVTGGEATVEAAPVTDAGDAAGELVEDCPLTRLLDN